MQIAVRSTYMAGVALIGAGVIAISPVAPPMPDVHLPAASASAVQLAAQVNPIMQWGQVIADALQNTKELAAGVLADPAPVLGQVVKNEFATAVTLSGSVRDFLAGVVTQLGQTPQMVKDALGQFAAGHITDGLITLYQAAIFPLIVPILNTNLLLDIQAAVRKPVQNMLNVIDTAISAPSSPTGLGWVLTAGFPLLQVSTDLVTATGDSIQSVLSALKSGKLGAALGAILAIPGTLTGALLNGYADDGAGILGPNGIVQGLRNALHIIATAIKPATTPPVASTGVAATSVAVEKVSATTIAAAPTGVTLAADDTAKVVGKQEVKVETATEPVTDIKAEVQVVTPAEKVTEKQVVISTTDAADVTYDAADTSGTQPAPEAKADRGKRGTRQKSSTDSTDATSTPSGMSTKRDRVGAKSGGKSAARSHERAHQSRHAGRN